MHMVVDLKNITYSVLIWLCIISLWQTIFEVYMQVHALCTTPVPKKPLNLLENMLFFMHIYHAINVITKYYRYKQNSLPYQKSITSWCFLLDADDPL
jgi:hypothetical protein